MSPENVIKPMSRNVDPRYLDFDPREVVGKYPNRYARTALAFAGTLAVTSGILAGLGANADLGDPDTLAEERQELEEAQEDLAGRLERKTDIVLKHDRELTELRIDLGEGCVALINTYMEGGTLADTPEDSIVSDIANNDNQPCGDNPTQIRENTRSLFEAEHSLVVAQRGLDEAREVTIESDLSGEESDVKDRLWLKGLALGLGLGAIYGTPKAIYRFKNLKHSITKKRLSRYMYPRMIEGASVFAETWQVKERAQEAAEDIIEAKFPEAMKG